MITGKRTSGIASPLQKPYLTRSGANLLVHAAQVHYFCASVTTYCVLFFLCFWESINSTRLEYNEWRINGNVAEAGR